MVERSRRRPSGRGSPVKKSPKSPKLSFVPALGLHLLTPLYDPIVAITTREAHFKRRLLDRASIPDRASVLDLGCGTGTLALQIARTRPKAGVTGLDGDERMLQRARNKAASVSARVRFDHGLAQELPYRKATFDRVVSSLFFHHLTRELKAQAAAEVYRVLRPGGKFHVADWGKPADPLMRLLFYPVRLIDGFEVTGDNVGGRLPEIFRTVGFTDVRTDEEIRTALGTLALYCGVKPAG